MPFGKWLVIVGLSVMFLGGVLMVQGFFIVEERHDAKILGAEFSLTENHRKPIPTAFSASVLAVGAVIAVAGALQTKPGPGKV